MKRWIAGVAPSAAKKICDRASDHRKIETIFVANDRLPRRPATGRGSACASLTGAPVRLAVVSVFEHEGHHHVDLILRRLPVFHAHGLLLHPRDRRVIR
jgi:hypothetical protein